MFYLREAFCFPTELEACMQNAVWGNREPTKQEIENTGKKISVLWPLLAKDLGEKKIEEARHYSEMQDLVAAYSAYYLPANAPKIPLILEEAKLLGLDILGENSKWLDFGSGPGTALWGLAWWAKARNKKFQFLGLEQSKAFLENASRLARGLKNYHNGHNANFQHFQGKSAKMVANTIIEQSGDIVSFVNSFHEFFPNLEQKQAAGKIILESLRAKSKRDGKPRWLLIIEPGTKENSRPLQESLRTWQDEKLARLWLPCLSNRPCGALTNPKDWCHEAADCEFPNWMKKIGSTIGLKKESLIFSYALLSVGDNSSLASMEWPSHGNRMVSQRLEQKGQTECYFCTEHGKIRTRVQHSKTNSHTEAFHEVNRGDIFTQLEAGEKGDVQKFKSLEIQSPMDLALFPSSSVLA